MDVDYHPKCCKSFFGTNEVPFIDLNEESLNEKALEIIRAKGALTGVQPKLSLNIEKSKESIRFTVVDEKSQFIIKPQSKSFVSLPENEDLSMHLANELGLEVAKHTLIRLNSGNLAYLTKRFDRIKNKKIATEDLCQLSESLTEQKYRGSYEKTGKVIRKYSSQPGLDVLTYFQLVVFSYVIGNSDMHLKNFSMFEKGKDIFCLSPAYDLLSTHLVIKNEIEQMSLSLNGKRNKFSRIDFVKLSENLQLSPKQIHYSFELFQKKREKLVWWIENSFLRDELKNEYLILLEKRINELK
jgi:serine/threonine-protein kinase HipA